MANVASRGSVEKSKSDKTLEEISLVKLQLHNAYIRFEQTSDTDLVEAIIYEIEALKAKYRYLLRIARTGVDAPENSPNFYNEK